MSIVGKVARKGGLKGLGKAAKLAMAGKNSQRRPLFSAYDFRGLNDVVTNEHQRCAEICLARRNRNGQFHTHGISG